MNANRSMEPAQHSDYSPTSAFQAATPPPACQICGRQDETLRLVVYPFVFSLIVATFRRSFSGLWCRVHRLQKQSLASLITATVGWIGIPFGFLYTPLTLFQLARGGIQPQEENQRLLRQIAEAKIRQGDRPGAIRCLEEALRLGEDSRAQEQLRRLYAGSIPAHQEKSHPSALLSFLAVLFLSAVLGITVGALDYAFTWFADLLLGQEISIYVAILEWVPLVAMAYLLSLVVSQLVSWALTTSRIGAPVLAFGVGLVAAAMAAYGIPQGSMVGDILRAMLKGESFGSVFNTLRVLGLAITQGGYWVLSDAFLSGDLMSVIYTVLVLVAAAFYLYLNLSTAHTTTQWQRRLRAIQQEVRPALVPSALGGWVALLGVLLSLTLATGIFWYLEYGAPTSDAEALYLQGQDAIYEGDLETAQESFQAALEADAEFNDARLLLGWTYYYQNDSQRARDCFQQLLEIEPDLLSAWIGMGFTCIDLQDRDAALEAFEHALTLDPDPPDEADIHLGLGEIYSSQNDYDQAIAAYRICLELDPEHIGASHALSKTYSYLGDFQSAIQQELHTNSLDPSWAASGAHLALLYHQTGQMELCNQALQDALALDPQDPYSLFLLSVVYEDMRMYETAVTYITKAVDATEASDPYYLSSLAGIMLLEKDFPGAGQALDQARAIEPENWYIVATQARLYLEQNHLEEAIQEYQQAKTVDPFSGYLPAMISFIYTLQNRDQEAMQEAQQAIEVDPYDPWSHIAFALALERQGDYSGALKAAQEAVRLSPTFDFAHYALGLAYQRLEQPEAAREAYQTFLSIYRGRNSTESFKALAEAYLAQQP